VLGSFLRLIYTS